METLYIKGTNGWSTFNNITVDDAVKIRRNIIKRRKNHKPAPIEIRVKMSNGDIVAYD